MSSTPRIGLVAGGGAVKAYAYHVGVLRGLAEDGFRFRGGPRWQAAAEPAPARQIDCYVGSSAGACAVASIAAGHEVEDLRLALFGRVPGVPTFGYRTLFAPVAPNPLRYARRVLRRLRLGQLQPSHLLDVGGLFTSAGVERYFRRHVLPTNRFADLGADLYLVATQVNSARKVVFGPRDSISSRGRYDDGCAYYDNVPVSEAIAAAVAVPPLFAPYGIDNPATGTRFHYYDGEVRESLSAHVALDAGAEFVIASSIWNPYVYNERVGTLADYGMSVLAEQAIHQAVEQKIRARRDQARRFDTLLQLLNHHGAEHGVPPAATARLRERVRELLDHRRGRVLYVVPDPGDTDFFFSSFFRFERRVVERCVAAGHRAYRRAVRLDPEFLEALDRARSADGQASGAVPRGPARREPAGRGPTRA